MLFTAADFESAVSASSTTEKQEYTKTDFHKIEPNKTLVPLLVLNLKVAAGMCCCRRSSIGLKVRQ